MTMRREHCAEAARLTLAAVEEGLHSDRLPAPARDPEGNTLAHMVWMREEMSRGDQSDAKANRWLGYIQGWLVAMGLATLDDCKKTNMSCAEPD